ncbi:40S ribosomal protein S8-like [Myxocyprinus asiaticus]|uniref:40S ribosomal protein S8-like n=1 Tax=Myxocyprinus asiaticus TaxID=70543 RepID=UPI002222527E|nr:40S ribosomal protein S8-like [Myxocyprinus asiaticus]XP_051556180.1 40S ribosomal protein S8-like [Myxocyprinus asiaticus]
MTAERTARSVLYWRSSSSKESFLPALLPDRDSVVGLMAMSLKAKNWSSEKDERQIDVQLTFIRPLKKIPQLGRCHCRSKMTQMQKLMRAHVKQQYRMSKSAGWTYVGTAVRRPPANTKIGPRRIHTVRVRGGNKKYRALRLDVGNFSWGSECCTRKTRIIDVVYNASNNELVRTKTLVKNCVVFVDSTPYRPWYESHYAIPLGRKKGAKLTPEEEENLNKKRSKKVQKKLNDRRKNSKISPLLEEQFQQGKLLACIASRPGQCGRADGYVLEGKELEFCRVPMHPILVYILFHLKINPDY